MRLSEAPTIHPSASVERSTLGRFVEIGARASIVETAVGDYSYIVNDADVIYTDIGKFCSIAAHTRINPGNHPHWRATQAHFTYRASAYFEGEEDEAAFFDWRRSQPVAIGHDVWIGHGAVILPGVSIGSGAIVGAGAVVTRPVRPYEVVVGVPAKVLRHRFPPAIAERLMALAWWDWDHERVRRALADFRTLPAEEFIEKHAAGQLPEPAATSDGPTSGRLRQDEAGES